jgi:multicomponent Na+:H+ antiporter subunit F
MTVIDVAFAVVVLAMAAATVRIVRGPSDADRAAGADVVFFAFVALVALVGIRNSSFYAIDVVLMCTLVGFLAALSMARLITGGKR